MLAPSLNVGTTTKTCTAAALDPLGAHGPGVRISDVSDPRPLSAIPPVGARITAFIVILFGGLAGALIGFALVDLQCDGNCATPKGLGLLTGAIVCAGGMAIVAVLALRAMGEWREINDRDQAGHAPR